MNEIALNKDMFNPENVTADKVTLMDKFGNPVFSCILEDARLLIEKGYARILSDDTIAMLNIPAFYYISHNKPIPVISIINGRGSKTENNKALKRRQSYDIGRR